MAGIIESLLDTLGEQTNRYEELLGLSKEKRDVIIANDIENLQKINHLENILISQNQKLEKKRQAIVADMAIVLNQKEKDLTLPKLIELMQDQPNERTALESARNRIKSIMDELREMNQLNGQLIQNALEFVEFESNLLKSASGNAPVYFPGSDNDYYEESQIDFRN
ncbi:MAG: flagellar protein FlgN [Defluviitaleaceae bacterium]|nr:flagellar protein FlgN [Defluviitaleaceae bacterium]